MGKGVETEQSATLEVELEFMSEHEMLFVRACEGQEEGSQLG